MASRGLGEVLRSLGSLEADKSWLGRLLREFGGVLEDIGVSSAACRESLGEF